MKDKNVVDEVLFQDKWMALKRKTVDGMPPITYMCETRCEGVIVAILPFRYNSGCKEFLTRFEYITAWSLTRTLCSITGGLEKSKTPFETVCIELEEESGYGNVSHLIESLGTCYGMKSSDTIYHLYSVNLTGAIPTSTDTVGDGSEWEKHGFCKWVDSTEVYKSPDTILHSLITRLS